MIENARYSIRERILAPSFKLDFELEGSWYNKYVIENLAVYLKIVDEAYWYDLNGNLITGEAPSYQKQGRDRFDKFDYGPYTRYIIIPSPHDSDRGLKHSFITPVTKDDFESCHEEGAIFDVN